MKGPRCCAEQHPQNITDPPACFTVGIWHCGAYFSCTLLHTQTLPSDWKRVKRDSSLHTTLCHWSKVQLRLCLHHCRRRLRFFSLTKGFRTPARPWKPRELRLRLNVFALTGVGAKALYLAAISPIDVRLFVFTTRTKRRWSRFVSSGGRPDLGLDSVVPSRSVLISTDCTVDRGHPVSFEISPRLLPHCLQATILPFSKALSSRRMLRKNGMPYASMAVYS
jgi:hypothetical protein